MPPVAASLLLLLPPLLILTPFFPKTSLHPPVTTHTFTPLPPLARCQCNSSRPWPPSLYPPPLPALSEVVSSAAAQEVKEGSNALGGKAKGVAEEKRGNNESEEDEEAVSDDGVGLGEGGVD